MKKLKLIFVFTSSMLATYFKSLGMLWKTGKENDCQYNINVTVFQGKNVSQVRDNFVAELKLLTEQYKKMAHEH